jgi:predicted neuraminidase
MKRRTGFVFNATSLFPQCHGSTLETSPDGCLIVAWYGGTRESDPDTAIYGSTLDSSGDEWTRPKLIAKVSDKAHWNPVLFRDPAGDMHLYFKVGNNIPSWETWHCVLNRDGRSFSDPVPLVPGDNSGGRGPVRNKMIVLSDGSWLAPASHETVVAVGPYRSDIWDAFVDRSTDMGKTWSASPYVGRQKVVGGFIQPALWESSPGNVHMLLRSTYGYVYRSDSTDFGRTWSTPVSTSVPNNNSAVDVVKMRSGLLVMAYNPVSGNWAARTPVSLAFSRDNGATWGEPQTIEHSFASKAGFAYPSIVETPSGDGIFMSYTWNRVGIRCLELKILNQDMEQALPIINVYRDSMKSLPAQMLKRMEARKKAIAERLAAG